MVENKVSNAKEEFHEDLSGEPRKASWRREDPGLEGRV